MKDSQDIQSTTGLKSSAKGTNEVQSQQPNPMPYDAPAGDSSSLSIASSSNKKVSHEDIKIVQNLIERCLQLYKNKEEVVNTLFTRATIEPAFTTLVWQKLEEENPEFFRAYYIRLKLKKQIIWFNQLLEQQYHLMKCSSPPNAPLVPMQNGLHPLPVTSFSMEHPVLQSIMPASGQPLIDPMACCKSSCQVANQIPASSGYHPNSGNEMAVDIGAPKAPIAGATCGSMSSEMAVISSSAMSSNHAPFTPSEIPGMAMDASALDSASGSDVGNAESLKLGLDSSSRDSVGSLGPLWNFSFSDLSDDFLKSMADLEALENYNGAPSLPSDSDILLDAPVHDDIGEYFADAINGPQSDEDRQ